MKLVLDDNWAIEVKGDFVQLADLFLPTSDGNNSKRKLFELANAG